ncbi:Cation/H+ exchanger, partial [Piptocephalis cylindrospora]
VYGSTLREFSGEEVHLTNVLRGFGMFGGVFFGSLAIGVIVGLACALLLKHTDLRLYPAIESCMVILIAYSTYLLPNAIHLSGIVSLLFCGMTLKHYAYDNLSRQSKRTTKYMFQVLAHLSENFIFIYLGLTLFTATDNKYLFFFIFSTFIIITVARYASVFPLSALINLVSRHVMRRSHDPMRPSHQMMLFWAGLRGAVAFALAFSFTGTDGPAARTTILSVVVLSILLFGGTTTRVVQLLGIRTGV